MPVVTCPFCYTHASLPDFWPHSEYTCPRCAAVVSLSAPPLSPPPNPFDLEEGPTRTVRGRPHRGGLILALGILSLIVCAPLGVFAWAMGSSDLEMMRRGRMDRSGEGVTQAGYVCGIIGTVFFAIGVIFAIMYLGLIAAMFV